MNNTALAIIQPDELDTIQRTAKLLAASGYFATTGDGITSMAQVASKILAGRELGFGPFAAVNGIHIIQGKPTVGANLMAAAVRAHPRYDYRVKELSDTVCELEFFDGGKVAGVSRFTAKEAETAELSTGKNGATWKKFPRNMLFARAMSNGVRWYAPDIFSGNAVYVPEELGANVDGDGNVIDTTYTVTRPATEPLRVVDQDTGEIVSPEPATDSLGDVVFSKAATPPVLSDEQLKEFNIVGRGFYGKEWDTVRPTLVQAVSKGAISSATELTPNEATKLIKGIQKKAAAAAQLQEPIATAA